MHTLPPMHSPHPPATEVGGYKNLRRVYKARPSWALRPIPNSMWSPFGFSWPGIWSSDTPCHNICPPFGARPDFEWYFGHICRRQQIWYFVQFERTIKQLNPDHLSCMWRLEPMLARSHTMPARGSFWPFWSDRRLYKVTMHLLHKFEANPAYHQAVISKKPPFGPPGWGREVRSAPFTSLFSPLGQSQPSCHQNAQ